MKIKLLYLLAFLLMPRTLFGQSTTVSGQVTDAGAQSWNNGTITAVFVINPAYPSFPQYAWTGGTLNSQVSGTLTGTGSYSLSIPSNSAITPVNSQWRFQICPQASSPCFYTSPITVTGATQTVNVTPPAILINLQTAAPPISAYSTSEVTGALIGSEFTLLSATPTLQICQAVSANVCTTWGSAGSGGVVTGPILPNTTIAFSSTPSFSASANASYTMTLTGNVTSSTITGSPANGNLLSFTLIEDSTGGRTFSFPSNFILPAGFVFSTTANSINASTWKFDGTNWNLILTGGSGTGSIGTPGLNLFYATSYGVVADVIYAQSGTCSNGSSTISTGAGENPFTSSVVGKAIAGIDSPPSAGGNANCPPQGTILTFVDAHHVTVSNTPSNPNGTISFLGWGTNSGSNLQTAYNASYGNGCLILPSGNIFFDVPPFLGSASVTNTNYPPCIIGQYNTNLTALPSFNVSGCDVGSKACFFRYGSIVNTLPNFAYLKDFEFLGGNNNSWNLTGNFSTYSPVNFNRVVAWNLWIWAVGGNSANSFSYGSQYTGPNYLHAFTVFSTGTIAGCLASGNGGTSAGLNQMTTSEQSYCKGAGGEALQINTGSRYTSYGSQFDTSACSSCDTVTNDGIFTSYGDIVLGASGTRSGLATTANGQSYVDGSWVKGAVAGQAINCSASGGQVILHGAVIDATASTQPAIKTVSGCNVVSGTSNKFNGSYTLSLASGTYSAPGHSVVGACTGTATSSSTLGLYGTGPNLTTSTCTSTTIGAGIVAPGGATLQNLVVFSTAVGTATAAVTVLRNGSTTTITCSLNGVTSCVDTTHSVALAAGDLISYQLVTGASETVSNVKAQVEWN